MRTDVLSLAAIIFVVGVLISGLGVTNVLHKNHPLGGITTGLRPDPA